jgi:sialic acid synthase SpsE
MITIGNTEITPNSLFFVVEEGQYNQGDLGKAIRMVELAAGAGADAVEFQLADADEFYIRNSSGYEIYKAREFSDIQLKELSRCCANNGIDLIVAAFSRRMVRTMADFGCSAFNVNASDLNNPQILKAVWETGLPFFLSLPLATPDEIRWALTYLESCGASPSGYVLLHGQHIMASGANGVSPVDTSLGFLSSLRSEEQNIVGFIDHTPLPWFPACAVAGGANIVTKHITTDHSERGPDWQICLDPKEMAQAIKWARDVRKSLDQTGKVLAPGENLDRAEMRRSALYSRDLPVGHCLSFDDLAFKRPGNGVSPNRAMELIGGHLRTTVCKDEKLMETHFEMMQP